MIAVPPTGPFFHRAADGDRFAGQERFWMFHAPATSRPAGSVLAVHAFAEEMNKTRAAVADGARALAAAGFGVLQIDLAGCGDSDGDFADASWPGWLADLAEGWAWLQQHCPGPRWLWGTRAGALLADQFAALCDPPADGLLLWQPVVNGAQHLGQFLRLKTVNQLLRDSPSRSKATASVTAPSPRADLADGRPVEVAGYRLTPALADALEAARIGTREASPPRVCWFEVSSQPAATPSPMAVRVTDRWRGRGSDVVLSMVAGPPFWQTQEVERCEALVAASVAALAAGAAS